VDKLRKIKMMKKGVIPFSLILFTLLFSLSVNAAGVDFNFTALTPIYNDSYGSATITFGCNVTASEAGLTISNITITVYTNGDNDSSATYLGENTSDGLNGGINNATTITIDVSDALRSSGIDLSELNGNLINFTYNCKASDDLGSENVSGNVTFLNPLMSFFGYVKNSTYTDAEGANITFSKFVMGNPPTVNLVQSTLTNASGYYAFFVNNSFLIETSIIQIAVTINASDENVTEVGPTLPPLPSPAILAYFANGTLYTQPAATLRISGYYANEEDLGGGMNDEFNYEITDLGLGLGMWNSINVNVTSPKDIVVPRDRNYSISWMRGPQGFGMGATPPLSSSVENISSYSDTNYVVEINKSLAFSRYLLSGYISVSGNSSYVNCTDMIIRLTPSSGNFVPPGSTVNGLEWNITGANIPGQDFYYDATMMGASDGINYVVEWYCNGTDEYYASIRRVQIGAENNQSFNVTATALSGNYDDTGNYMSNTFNTSTECIQIYDMTDPSNPSTSINNLNLNLEVTDASFGTLMYVTQVSSGAALNWTILNSSTVKVRVFSQQFPPYRTTIDLNKDYCGPDANISLKPFNMETIDENGAKQVFSSNAMRMRFMRNTAACNVVTPDDSCVVGDTLDPNSFNPLAAMMTGKTNLMIDLNNGTGNSIYFINVDMMSSGPPDAVLSENASLTNVRSDTLDQLWRFGSFAPDIYDYVLIGIPYNENTVNENWTITTKMPVLYDENSNIIWNITDNGTSFDAISGNYTDYADYPSTWFTGMSCSTSDSTFSTTSCYMNLSENKFWLKLPHFSEVGPNINGNAPLSSSSTGGGGSGGGSGTGGLFIDISLGRTVEFQTWDRASFIVKGKEHTIQPTQIVADHVTFEIRSAPLIVVVETGKTKEVDVDADGTNDLTITVKKVDVRYKTAEVYIKEIEKQAPTIPTGEVTKEPEKQPPTGKVEIPPIPTIGEEFKSKPTWVQIFVTIIMVIVLFMILMFIIYKKKKHNRYC